MSILVSVNCVTYNQEKYIEQTIKSVLKQITDFDFELLIGEDCSTDNTKQIVEEYQRNFPEKIRIITSEKNVGSRENTVRLHKESKGKYIALCEGDDYWVDPYKLQKQIDYMEANSGCTFTFHNAYLLKDTQKEVNHEYTLIKKNNPYYRNGNSSYNAGELALFGFIPTSSFIYHKKLMDNPPEWYHTAVVSDISKKLIPTIHGYAHYIDENMGVYRIGIEGSITDNWRKESGNRQKMVNLNRGFCELLDNINTYSNYKYQDELSKAKIPFEVLLIGLEGKKNEIKNPRYKAYIDAMSKKEKLSNYVRIYFPKSFLLLTRLKI